MKFLFQSLFIVALIVSTNFDSIAQINVNKRPNIQHVYLLEPMRMGEPSQIDIGCDRSGDYKVVNIVNYSILDLLAFAIGRGKVDNDKIIIQSSSPDQLNKKYCFRMVVPQQNSKQWYQLMLKSLSDQFSTFNFKLKNENGQSLLIIEDKLTS